MELELYLSILQKRPAMFALNSRDLHAAPKESVNTRYNTRQFAGRIIHTSRYPILSNREKHTGSRKIIQIKKEGRK
jgi:hypothetical protein